MQILVCPRHIQIDHRGTTNQVFTVSGISNSNNSDLSNLVLDIIQDLFISASFCVDRLKFAFIAVVVLGSSTKMAIGSGQPSGYGSRFRWAGMPHGTADKATKAGGGATTMEEGGGRRSGVIPAIVRTYFKTSFRATLRKLNLV